nr:unnamed protein product [Callosobruchus analis]
MLLGYLGEVILHHKCVPTFTTTANMADCRAPEEMKWEGDVASHWKLWQQKLNNYLLASGKANKDDNVKIVTLLNLMGENGLIIYNTFDYSEDEDRNKLQTVLQKFDAYCNPIKNLMWEEAKEENTVSMIKSKSRSKWAPSRSYKEKYPPNKARNAPNSSSDSKTCKYCGLQHQKGQCTAFNRTCSRCSKKGHYIVECIESDQSPESEESETDTYSETSDKSHSPHHKQIVWTITTSSVSTIEWHEPPRISPNPKLGKSKAELKAVVSGLPISPLASTSTTPTPTPPTAALGAVRGSENFRDKATRGPYPILSLEETCLTDWIYACQNKGFPLRIEDVLESVKGFLDANPRDNPFTENMPGRGWYRCFFKKKSRNNAQLFTTDYSGKF